MKKLLALVLALVMTLGLATVGANAATTAYKDADKINYKEAVDVMSAIGILAGDETGFRPTDNLKRSEGAKIIAYMLLGNKNADGLSGSGAKFSDVPANHWAAGYIEYLAAEGVIGGVGDGKFNPDGTLTTVQFAKMLLTALGYDAEIEKLGGPDWSINTQKIANQVDVKLFDGNNNASANSNITREEAALYAFNTLRTPLVQYESKGTSINVNGATITSGASNVSYKTDTVAKNQKISNKRLNEGQGVAVTPYLVEFAEFYYPNLELVGQGKGIDDLGRPTREWTYYNAKIGEYVMSGDLVKSWDKKVTAKVVYDTIGKSIYDSLARAAWTGTNNALSSGTALVVHEDGVNAWNGLRTNEEGDAPVPVGYNAGGSITSSNLDPYIHRTNTTKVNHTGNGSVTELYQDDDNNLWLATYHTYLYKAAGNYSESSKTVTLVTGNDLSPVLKDNKIKVEDFPQIADLKGDDYVLVTVAKSEANRYDVKSVAKAEIVTGTVNQYNTGDSQELVMDSTTYKYSEMVEADTKNTKYSVGQKAKVVLDGHGNIIAVDESLTTSDYLFVRNWGTTGGTLNTSAYADVVFTDGKKATVKVKSAYDYVSGNEIKNEGTINGWNNVAAQMNKWYTYSKNSADEYTLYQVESKYLNDAVATVTGAAAAGTTVVKNSDSNFFPTSGRLADDKTVFIVRDMTGTEDEISVYEGVKNAPEILFGAAAAAADFVTAYVMYNTNNNYARLVYLVADGANTIVTGGGENLTYVVKYKTETHVANNEVYYTYVTFDENGKEVEVKADSKINDNISSVNAKYFGVARYVRKNSNDQLIGFKAVTALGIGGAIHAATGVTGTITYSDGTFSLVNAGESFPVDSNTKFTLVTMGNITTITATRDLAAKANATALNSDKAADYEVTVGTGTSGAKNLISTLKGYDLVYDYAVKTKSTSNMVAEEVFVTVQKATSTQTLGNGATAADINKALAAADYVTVTGNATIAEAVTIASGKTLDITGTVTKTATITNNGTLIVGGTLVESAVGLINNGTAILNGLQIKVSEPVTNNGTIIVGTLTVDSGKTFTFNNITSADDVVNNGTIVGNVELPEDGTYTGSGTIDGGEVVYETSADTKAIALKIVA